MIKIKTLELFGGIGAPRSALENLKVFEIKAVDYVEILSNAVKAYNAMYDLSYKPQDVLEWNLNVDLLVHGSPCQDWSNAGLNDVNSGRSILYQRTLEIIEKELHPKPKYILWENVVGLISAKHYKHFNHYIESMEKLGYKSYYGILEAKEFGIPQTRPRVFTISIRNDIDQVFDFDVLERKPMIPFKEFLYPDLKGLDNKKSIEFKQPSMWKAIEENKVKIIVKITSTITTKQVRWNNAGVVFKDESFYKQDFSKIPEPKSKYGYSLEECKKYFPKYFENKKDLSQVFRYLTPKECWALMGYDVKEKTYKDFENFYTIPRKTDGKLINGSYNRVWKATNYVGTIPASAKLKIGELDENGELNYRELTPYECWKLQGYSLSQFDRVKATGISDSDMYALAGNSICVPVLEAIFKELLIDKKSVKTTYLAHAQPKQLSLFEDENEVENFKDIIRSKT